jgi:hypothetical protein
MHYTSDRAKELISLVPWAPGEKLRVLWLRLSDEGRQAFASRLECVQGDEAIIPVILREPGFVSANAVMSDVNRLIDSNRAAIERVPTEGLQRLSLVILSKDDFRLPQISSPIVLPTWFPFLGGAESSFKICDLAQQAEVSMLNCPEVRSEHLAELVLDLEAALVERLCAMQSSRPGELSKFIQVSCGVAGPNGEAVALVNEFRAHVDVAAANPRVYRPDGSRMSSLATRLIRLVLNNSPKDLAKHAGSLAASIGDNGAMSIRPSLIAAMLRPGSRLEVAQANMHSVLLSLYQAYQLMNGAAHAGEFGAYPVSLLYATSSDVRRCLLDAARFVRSLP